MTKIAGISWVSYYGKDQFKLKGCGPFLQVKSAILNDGNINMNA